MKPFLVILFCIPCTVLCAQVGRFEEPRDTVPIGGEIQENKLNQMEMQDDLRVTLVQLKDSLQYLPSATRANVEEDLEALVRQLDKTEREPELMKRGYALVTRIRTHLKSAKK